MTEINVGQICIYFLEQSDSKYTVRDKYHQENEPCRCSRHHLESGLAIPDSCLEANNLFVETSCRGKGGRNTVHSLTIQIHNFMTQRNDDVLHLNISSGGHQHASVLKLCIWMVIEWTVFHLLITVEYPYSILSFLVCFQFRRWWSVAVFCITMANKAFTGFALTKEKWKSTFVSWSNLFKWNHLLRQSDKLLVGGNHSENKDIGSQTCRWH